MSKKHEGISSPTLFYTFLDFGRSLTDPPACFVAPSAIVADVGKRSHETWTSLPGARGRAHKDSDMRRFMPDFTRVGLDIDCGPGWLEPHREAWDSMAGIALRER